MQISEQQASSGVDIERARVFFDRLKSEKPKLKGRHHPESVARRLHRLLDEIGGRIDHRGWRTELMKQIDGNATSSKRLREFTLTESGGDEKRARQLRKGALEYAQLAVEAARMAKEPHPEIRLLGLFEGTNVDPARSARAPALDAFDPIRELQLLIEDTVASVVKRHDLDSYFASLGRHTGRWCPSTMKFRSSDEPLLLGWRFFDQAYSTVEEVPPFPSVPLAYVPQMSWDDVLAVDEHTPIDDIDRTATSTSPSGPGCTMLKGRMTVSSEIRLAIGPTTGAAIIGPLLEHRMLASFASGPEGEETISDLVLPYGLFDDLRERQQRSRLPLVIRAKGRMYRAELKSTAANSEAWRIDEAREASRIAEFIEMHDEPAADINPEGEYWWETVARVVEPHYFHWFGLTYGRLWQLCQIDVSLTEGSSRSEHFASFASSSLPVDRSSRASLLPRKLAGRRLEEFILTESLLRALDSDCRALRDRLEMYLGDKQSGAAGRYSAYRARLRNYASSVDEGKPS